MEFAPSPSQSDVSGHGSDEDTPVEISTNDNSTSTASTSRQPKPRDESNKEVSEKSKTSKSIMWKHFSPVKGHPNKVRCHYCLKGKDIFSYNNTTSTHVTHLRRRHGNIVDVRKDVGEDKPAKDSIKNHLDKADPKRLPPLSQQRKKEIDAACAGLCYLDLRPTNITKGRGFKWFVRALNPQYKAPDPTSLTRTHIPDAYHDVKKLVIADVEVTRIWYNLKFGKSI